MKGKFLLVIGAIIALSALGYACAAKPPSNSSIPSGAEMVVDLAKEDLAKRKGIDKGKIMVVAVEAVDWPDTSLGCPEPEMFYAQVITPGYKILLAHGKETYEYHSDQNDRVVHCESKS